MSERERATGATWKAVRTLEYKKKQKAPHSEPKGFGAILDEAHDAVTDKRTTSSNTVSSYLNRLSEIQIQDEAYIHQQLVKPDEVKAKRGLQTFITKGKGRGIRLSRSVSSRKVRFNEDAHSKAAQPGAVRPDVASAEQLAQADKVSNPTTPKRSVGFRCSSKSPGARRAGSFGFKDGDRLDSTTAAAAAAAAEQGIMPPADLAATGKGIARRSGTSSGNNSNAGAVSIAADGHAAVGPGCHGTANGQLAQLTIGSTAAPASTTTCGDVRIMAKFLNQHFDDPPESAPNNDGSSSGHWEGPSKTQLADQQLQLLRTTVPTQASAEGPGRHEQPDAFRPLAIPEDIFARWSSAAGGINNCGSSKCASGCSGSPSKPSADGDASSQHQASRRVSSSGILRMPAADQQMLSGSGASTSSHMRSMRSTAEYTMGSHAGAADRSKQRRSADDTGVLTGYRRCSCDGQGSRLGSGKATLSSETPERHVSSPRLCSTSTTAQHSSSPVSLPSPGGLKGRSNRLLELSTAGNAMEAHHLLSPSGSGAASSLTGGHTRLLIPSSHSPVGSSSGSGAGGAAGLQKSSDKGLHLPNIGRAAVN